MAYCVLDQDTEFGQLRQLWHQGKLSMKDLIDRVDLGPNATYEDYCDLFDQMLD